MDSLFSFFLEGELDTFSWEEWDDWFLSFSNDEDVANSCGEGVTLSVLNVGNVETSWMLFNVLEDTNSTDVVTTIDQNWSSVFELNNSVDFSSLKIQL